MGTTVALLILAACLACFLAGRAAGQPTIAGEQIMEFIGRVEEAVAAQTTVIGGVVTLLETIHQELIDARAANDPAREQAALDALAAGTQTLAEATVRNTDSPEAPPADPPV